LRGHSALISVQGIPQTFSVYLEEDSVESLTEPVGHPLLEILSSTGAATCVRAGSLQMMRVD